MGHHLVPSLLCFHGCGSYLGFLNFRNAIDETCSAMWPLWLLQKWIQCPQWSVCSSLIIHKPWVKHVANPPEPCQHLRNIRWPPSYVCCFINFHINYGCLLDNTQVSSANLAVVWDSHQIQLHQETPLGQHPTTKLRSKGPRRTRSVTGEKGPEWCRDGLWNQIHALNSGILTGI